MMIPLYGRVLLVIIWMTSNSYSRRGEPNKNSESQLLRDLLQYPWVVNVIGLRNTVMVGRSWMNGINLQVPISSRFSCSSSRVGTSYSILNSPEH